MNAAARTTTALLQGLHAQDGEEWAEFDARFRPILRAFVSRLGLGDADVEDLTQEALTRFVRLYREGKYDKDRGRLSSWLISIAHHCAMELRHKQVGRREKRGESALVDVSHADSLERLWEEECHRVMLERAMRELRDTSRFDEKTIAAFESLALDQCEPAEIASRLNLSIDSVYAAKSRCIGQLREILHRLNAIYEVA